MLVVSLGGISWSRLETEERASFGEKGMHAHHYVWSITLISNDQIVTKNVWIIDFFDVRWKAWTWRKLFGYRKRTTLWFLMLDQRQSTRMWALIRFLIWWSLCSLLNGEFMCVNAEGSSSRSYQCGDVQTDTGMDAMGHSSPSWICFLRYLLWHWIESRVYSKYMLFNEIKSFVFIYHWLLWIYSVCWYAAKTDARLLLFDVVIYRINL